jgi:magnesium-transporting ATPase (P-type)
MNLELVFNGFLMLFLFGILMMSRQISGVKISSDTIGPSGFPQTIIVIAIIILVTLSYRLIKVKKSENIVDSQKLKTVGLVMTMQFAYIFALNILGYIVSTLIFPFFIGRTIGYRKNAILAIFSIILTAVMVLVFGNLFSVPLPRGIGLLRELSYFIY